MAENSTTAAWPIGYRIKPRAEGPSDEWIARFQGVPAAFVSDSMGRSTGSYGLNIYHGDIGLIMVGRAFTVRVRPGDNLMIHKALELAVAGDVLVIDSGGDVSQSLIGGNILATATFKKLAGFVIDGAVRDIAEIATGSMPVWARGHTHRGPNKDGPGEINVPVAVGGMAVMPGDLIIGDADGVVAIPPADLEALWPHVESQIKKEKASRHKAETGTNDPERFNSILRARGCPV
jgi:regulator of RNase E activity RraA